MMKARKIVDEMDSYVPGKSQGEIAEQFFIDSVMTLRLQMLDDAIAECNARYIQETDLEKRKEISKTLQALITQKKNLRRRK